MFVGHVSASCSDHNAVRQTYEENIFRRTESCRSGGKSHLATLNIFVE